MYTREALRELNATLNSIDAPSAVECMAEVEETIRQLEAGDTASVPPWLTPAECLEQARAELARYQAYFERQTG